MWVSSLLCILKHLDSQMSPHVVAVSQVWSRVWSDQWIGAHASTCQNHQQNPQKEKFVQQILKSVNKKEMLVAKPLE